MPDDSVFGDDTNATPLTKLNIPQMSSNRNQPLDAPVYSPDVPVPEKQVRFADPQQQPPPPPPPRPMQRRFYRPPPPPPPPPQPPALLPEAKQSKFALLVDTYAHRLMVFAVVCLVLYWYQPLIHLPYIGNQTSTHMTVFGITVVAMLGASLYGIGEYLVD